MGILFEQASMAAACLGMFGDFKYSRDDPELVWVSKPYEPLDGRESAPVARFKAVKNVPTSPGGLSADWKSVEEHVTVANIPRSREEKDVYPSMPSTRCENWSSLREILPSRGIPKRFEHPRWGTGLGGSPQMTTVEPRRHPIINSAMTRYVDAMHLTNKEFKMF